MEVQNKILIHIWVFNHPFNGISDQVKFFTAVLRQNGYVVSVGLNPVNSALNVVIENFSASSKDILRAYCKATKKRVAVIMTEHLDFINGQIFIHGDPLWSDNDYMHPATQLNRIKYLMECIPYIKCFFTMGDLPELKGASIMFPGILVRSIPFPKLDFLLNNDIRYLELINEDFLFTGALTEYRNRVFLSLKVNGLSVFYPQRLVSCKRRRLLTKSTKLTLNIPQRSDWHWLSLMRVITALRYGRATISLGTNDESKIAACTYQLDLNDDDWPDRLKEYVKNWYPLYKAAYEKYMKMAIEYEKLEGFPHDLFEYWAITDQLTF